MQSALFPLVHGLLMEQSVIKNLIAEVIYVCINDYLQKPERIVLVT